MRTFTILCFASLISVSGLLAQKELPYKAVEGWAQLPADYKPGAGMATAVDADGDIWYYNRGSHAVIEFSKDGKVLRAWPEDPKRTTHATAAHGMAVGVDGALWLVGREAKHDLEVFAGGPESAYDREFFVATGRQLSQVRLRSARGGGSR